MFYSYRSPFRGLFFGQRNGAKRWFCAAIIHNLVIGLFFRGLSPERSEPIGEKSTITTCYVYIALGCFFSGASAARWWRLECKRLFCFSQKVWQKKTTAGWIVRKPTKRPCKPRGTRGGDFWRLGILPAELPVIYFQALPDRIYLVFRTKKNNLLAVCPYGLQANF